MTSLTYEIYDPTDYTVKESGFSTLEAVQTRVKGGGSVLPLELSRGIHPNRSERGQRKVLCRVVQNK